ncbi:MAG TPA: hypothetical protein VEA41_14670, partial [Salinarimonas sp.]|nr:hypothetical protein [Salinarimonas sp.]
EFWEAESGEYNGATRLGALKSAGPAPGVPEPQNTSHLVLQASGSQSWNKELRVAVHRSGMPDDRGTFRWRYDGDTNWYGWEPPVAISAWEALDWTNDASRNWVHPHAVTLADDAVLVIAEYDAGALYTTACWRRDPDTGAWTRKTDLAAASATAAYPCLCLVPLPTGGERVVAFYWLSGSTTADVGMSWSDDAGTTWTEGARAVLPESWTLTSWTPKRLRAAYLNGQILLIASMQSLDTAGHTMEDILVQFASTDMGASFVEVYRQDVDSESGGAYPDIVVQGGGFVVGAVTLTGVPSNYPVAIRLGSAFESIGDVTPVTIDVAAPATGTDFLTEGDLCLAVDDAGALYVTFRRYSDRVWTTFRSDDGGAEWAPMGANDLASSRGTWWRADAGTYPDDACAVFQRGRMLVIFGHVSSPGAYDESLSCAYLGGYSTFTLPPLSPNDLDAARVSYTTTWLPFDLPDDMGWTATTTGAPTASISSGRLRVQAAAGEGKWYHQTPTGTNAGGILADIITEADADTAFLQVRQYQGGVGYEAEIRVTPTAVQLWDAVANVQRSSWTITGAGEVQVRVVLVNGSLLVRVRDYSNGSARSWTTLTGTLTDDAGGTFTTDRVRFGVPSTGVAQRDVYFRFLGWVDDEGGANPFAGIDMPTWVSAYANPGSIHGRGLSSLPTYVDDGVRLAALDGPGFSGETWHIDTRYTHPVTRILPHVEPSPARGWRSAAISDFDASTTHLHLAFRLDGDGDGGFLGEDCSLENDLVAAYLDGLNCPQVAVDLYYGGAWNSTTTTSGVTFVASRKGNTVRPAANAAGSKVRFGEMVGGHIAFHNAGYTTTTHTTVVTSNTEGNTRTDSVTKHPTFVMRDSDNALAASPSVSVWPTRHLIVAHPSGYSRDIQGVRLRIPVSGASAYPGRPADGYYEVGTFAFGPVLVFGHDYSWEHNASIEANVDLATARDGSRRSRVLGPPRETWEIGWADGVDTTDYHQATASNYIKGSANAGAVAVAFRHDTPYLLQDWLRAEDGPDALVVFLPSLAYDSASGSSGDVVSAWTNFATGAVYGRVTSPVRIETILGEEFSNEMLRISSLTLESEV